jgi:enoyl-CoA hydratase/carnithine racemase
MTGRVLSAGEARDRGVLADIGGPGAALSIAREIAAAPPAATREVKRRVLLAAETTWLPLLADETEQLRTALLGD